LENRAISKQQEAPGRPRKVTKTTLGMSKRQATQFPVMAAENIKASVPELAAISIRIIYRALLQHLKYCLSDWQHKSPKGQTF